MSPPELPRELVYEIARHLISPPAHVKYDLKKLEWPCIQSMSISSRLFRRAALDCWFASIFIRERSDWKDIERFAPINLLQTVSRIHIFPAALDPQAVTRLKRYENLKILSVNMHVAWQESPENFHLVRLLVPCIPRSIIALEISCVSVEQFQDLEPLLANIAGNCPSLRRLGLYSAASDCKECIDETRLPFPIPTRSAGQLADALAQALSNLKYIRSLSLPIHLSQEEICIAHLTGHPIMPVNERTPESNCDKCVKEFGTSTHNNEKVVAETLAQRLRSLDSIHFGSWVYGRGRGGVHFVRPPIGSELKYQLVPSYIGTQQWDSGRVWIKTEKKNRA
ncbi:unnamed protein product [Rhizoctonia solani]|uniref:Histone deacetylase family protein n=1 Tax=Rhizoctonia solani TaxID=456999 RepID=A0A8H3GKQ9_9AGAM|nr:histone deacetylase family protein [Rhizoctonia solani]KAF8680901.1 hypothetical protein RHS04_03367 [Rhizoctonia solani]KAF8759598.1 hypothetical protein RHS01_01867 [Rhizoctonia solani]QRW16063.1 histone deacetylase family protein [Rhizoctonia solani]CAE6459020.1 unnamed protein product [Rhizoctonia solani]